MRPTDWFLMELPVDPTPGDAFGVRNLAATYATIAEIADDAARGVHAARTSAASSEWVGDAADVFRDRSHRMPGELTHAHESYAAIAAALRRWAETIDDTQAQADRGLQQAREAHADRAAATGALASAELAWTTAHAQQLTYQLLQKSPLSVPPPAPTQLRSTDRAAQHAQLAIAAARGQVADADARLAAARALVLQAKERRDEGERATVHAIAAAGDLAVQPSSIWEAIQDSAAWQTIVAVATVVLTIVSIVAIFVGGPLVWALILAATILLVVNALLSIAQGKDAWGELAMLAVGLIPGGRLLGLAVRGIEAATRVSSAAAHLADLTARVSDGVGDGLQRVMVKLADDSGELRLPGRPELPGEPRSPFETMWSQKSVSFHKIDRTTGEHYTYDDIVNSMMKDGWKGDSIDVVDFGEHGVTSLDNTRLLAAQVTNTTLRVTVHSPLDALTDNEMRRFTPPGSNVSPIDWGSAATMRIGHQGARWARENPYGTSIPPQLTGRTR